MATFWLSHGVPVKVVGERLGHAHISITLQIYGHVLPHLQSAAAETMDDLLLNAVPATIPISSPRTDTIDATGLDAPHT